MSRADKYISNVEPKLQQIKGWIGIYTEAQIAKKLGVSVASFERYKNKYPELRNTLKLGKEQLIAELKDTLKTKAKGFHYTETKTTAREVDGVLTKVVEKFERYSPPDTGAIHLLLKNLDESWHNDDKATLDLKREKLEIEKQKAEETW